MIHTPVNEIADILDAAADLFLTYPQGRTTEELWDEDDNRIGVCAVTALSFEARGRIGAFAEAHRALADYLGARPFGLVEWSDASPDGVVPDAMRRCAKALREVEP